MPCLTFLSSACVPSLPTTCTPWFRPMIKLCCGGFANIYNFALLVFVYHWFWVSTLHGVGPLLIHVIMSSHTTSHTHPIQDIQENVISTRATTCFSLEVPHQWKLSISVGNLVKVFCILNIWWSCWIKGFEWLNQHGQSLQSTLSPKHERNSGMRHWEVFLLSTVPLSFLLHCQCIFHRFLCPSFVNLGTRFLLRGEGYNTPCYGFPNHLHWGLNQGSNPLINFISE
jgi:hypothetical protein